MSLLKRWFRHLTKREPLLAIIGEEVKRGLDNFKKWFEDYEVEYVVADLQLQIRGIKSNLQVKLRNKKQNIEVITAEPKEPIKIMKRK